MRVHCVSGTRTAQVGRIVRQDAGNARPYLSALGRGAVQLERRVHRHESAHRVAAQHHRCVAVLALIRAHFCGQPLDEPIDGDLERAPRRVRGVYTCRDGEVRVGLEEQVSKTVRELLERRLGAPLEAASRRSAYPCTNTTSTPPRSDIDARGSYLHYATSSTQRRPARVAARAAAFSPMLRPQLSRSAPPATGQFCISAIARAASSFRANCTNPQSWPRGMLTESIGPNGEKSEYRVVSEARLNRLPTKTVVLFGSSALEVCATARAEASIGAALDVVSPSSFWRKLRVVGTREVEVLSEELVRVVSEARRRDPARLAGVVALRCARGGRLRGSGGVAAVVLSRSRADFHGVWRGTSIVCCISTKARSQSCAEEKQTSACVALPWRSMRTDFMRNGSGRAESTAPVFSET